MRTGVAWWWSWLWSPASPSSPDLCPSVLQELDSRSWPYVYPNKYPEAPKAPEEDCWREERKGKEERPRPKDLLQKEEGKEGGERRSPEEHRSGGKEARTPHMQFSPHLAQHQGYLPYVHGPYAYGHAYEPTHPGYRGVPPVMMQNYPGRNRQQLACPSLPR